MAMDLPKLRKLLALDPNDPLSRYALGRKLWEQASSDPANTHSMLAEAIGHLRFANAADPRHLATYHVLSAALIAADLPDEARPVLRAGLAKASAVTEGMGKDLGPLMAAMLDSIGHRSAAAPDPTTITLSQAPAAEVIDLRWRVLRPGMDRSAAIFPGDDAPSTIHIVAKDSAGHVVCCATMHDEPFVDPQTQSTTPSWRLRGMATHPIWQGSGIGAKVLSLAESTALAARHVDLFWCQARLPALAFYERRGWQRRSPEFLIPTAGPHFVMTRTVSSPAAR